MAGTYVLFKAVFLTYLFIFVLVGICPMGGLDPFFGCVLQGSAKWLHVGQIVPLIVELSTRDIFCIHRRAFYMVAPAF